MKILLSSYFLLGMLLFAGCTGQQNMPTGMTLLVVNEDSCLKWNMPPVSFRAGIPPSIELQTPKGDPALINTNYVQLLSYGMGNTVLEAMNISHANIVESGGNKRLLASVGEIFGQVFDLRDTSLAMQNFGGKKMYQWRGIGTSKVKGAFSGDYRIVLFVLEPEQNKKNGVLISMIANTETSIKTFEDFADKGEIAEVYRSFEFTY
ncbi:MAG: hypothetical protein M3Q97_02405 [Bacteroidota bacterium]|nr:hypothetical protein [Bacteroidota bacterium]